MVVIDCRTGKKVKVGEVVSFGDVVGLDGQTRPSGESYSLLELEDWLVAAKVKVLTVGPDYRKVTSWWLPLRPFHPAGQGEARVFLVPT
jgi:hypothetical protein